MPKIRLTMLFHHQTSATNLANAPPIRTAGWSESYYYDDATTTPAQVALVQSFRAALLPTQSTIIGQRYQPESGASYTATQTYSGGSGEYVDVPQMGLLCRATNNTAQSTRKFTLRGLPDDWVRRGEWINTQQPNDYVQSFFRQLVQSQFMWRAADRSQPTRDVTSITVGGLVTTSVAHGYAVGDLIQLRRCRMSFGLYAKGKYRVLTVPDATTFTLSGYTQPFAVTIGKVRKVAYAYPTFQTGFVAIQRVVVAKVGRSFFQFSGKAKRRSA